MSVADSAKNVLGMNFFNTLARNFLPSRYFSSPIGVDGRVIRQRAALCGAHTSRRRYARL
jgi:hypothetical protein